MNRCCRLFWWRVAAYFLTFWCYTSNFLFARGGIEGLGFGVALVFIWGGARWNRSLFNEILVHVASPHSAASRLPERQVLLLTARHFYVCVCSLLLRRLLFLIIVGIRSFRCLVFGDIFRLPWGLFCPLPLLLSDAGSGAVQHADYLHI